MFPAGKMDAGAFEHADPRKRGIVDCPVDVELAATFKVRRSRVVLPVAGIILSPARMVLP
jgi:hypothetical protein